MTFSARLFLALSVAPFLVAQTKYQTDVTAMSPLGFWPLNGNPTDVSGHGNNGTLVNAPFFSNLFSSPAEPQSLVLNAAAKQLVVAPAGSSTLFNLGSLHPLTAIAWVKTVSQGNSLMVIVGKGDPATNTGWLLGIDNSDSGDPGSSGRLLLLFLAGGNATLAVEASAARNDGGWHMLAATYDGSGHASGVKLYIDGVLVNNPTVAVDNVSAGSILNSAPLTIGADPNGNSPFDGLLSGVAVFGTALTASQIQQLADDAGTSKAYLGQFAFGGGWYSAVYFTNTTANDVSFPVSFTADNGTPLSVPSIGASSKTVTLAAGASTVIEALNVGPDIQQGYVTVTLPVGVTGYGVFRQSIPGKPDQEAVALLFPANAANVPMVYDDTKYITGIAIANPSGNPTTVNITVTDNTGTVIATTSGVLQPFTKIEGLLRSLPAPFGSLSQIAGTQGTVRFATTSGPVIVLGLRANGTALTSIPAQTQAQISRFIGTL